MYNMPLVSKSNIKNTVHKDFTKNGKLLLGKSSMCQFTKDNLENAIWTLKVAGYEFKSENILCDGMGLLYRSDIDDISEVVSLQYMNIPVCFIELEYRNEETEDSIGIKISHNHYSHMVNIPSNRAVMWLSRYMDDKEVDGLYNYHFLVTLCDKSVDIDVFMEKYERLGMETDITQVRLPESYFKIPLG